MSHPPYERYPISPYASYPPPHLQGPPPSKTQAGWAMGLAFVPGLITWIIAVVLACQVISRSKDGRDHGKGMAVAAFWIMGGWVVIAIVIGTALVVSDAERDDAGRVTDGGRATIASLRVGDCLPAPEANGDEQLTLPIVPCSEPHDAEVYASFDLDGEWTNRADVDEISAAGCLERFTDYVGVPASRSSLEVVYFSPISPMAYREDSGVVCILVSPEPLTASIEGTGLQHARS